MKKLRTALFLVLAFTLLMAGTGVLSQAPQDTLLRFAHAIPGAAAVDIYINSELTVADLDFGQASSYIEVPSSNLLITVTPTGATSPLWEQNYTPGTGRAFTLVASSFQEPVAFTAFEDTLEPLDVGKARFTTIHAIADGPAIDVVLDDGRPLVVQQAYNQPYGTLDVPVFAYNLAVVPSGEDAENALITLDNTPLNTSTSYMLLVYGTAANPQAELLSAPAQAASEDTGYLKFIHAAPAAPAVDVYINDGVLAATLLPPGEAANATNYIALPAGDYDVELRPSGEQDVLLSTSATVNSDEYTTAVALGDGEEIALSLLQDDISGVTPDQAFVRVINASEESISASLSDGTVIGSDVASGSASDITATAPDVQSIALLSGAESVSLPEQPFYGGAFYDVVAVADAEASTISESALAQTVGSAPGATGGTQLVEEIAEPTAAPTVAAVQPTEAPPAPTTAPQPTAAPVVIPAGDAITGRVFNLNVDANLHLRQYPDTQALSLGTVPFGTILTVNGREGELEEIFISATQIPADYEYVDPVSLLEDERDDLNPEETWLNVTYDTPDGGTIQAWVRADFIDVREASGDQVPLRDLETVAGNLPGEALNTDITPPPVPENVVMVEVINLDPNANLNVRRTPDTLAEVLVQLPLGTTAEFLGLSEDGEWILLRYAAGDGTITTGWASTGFLQLVYRGNAVDQAELDERGLLVIADTTQRGSQTVGAAPVIAPTVDPTIDAIVAEVALDPGANLNLRRSPDTNAEVLAQIPSGTQLIVSARTADSQWLNVTYEGIDGWVAAQTDEAVFVVLSFNGAPVEFEEIPVADAG